MKLNLLFFASLREQIGTDAEHVDLPADVTTAGQLRRWLADRGDGWQTALAPDKAVRIAVNQSLADENTELPENAEVAFFPPVTGG